MGVKLLHGNIVSRLSRATAIVSLLLSSTLPVSANTTFTIYVAPKNTDAYDAAKTIAADSDKGTGATQNVLTVLGVERRIHRAFALAHDTLQSCGNCEVHIKIAAGKYLGKTSSGHWVFPSTIAPDATLKILGGYDATFTTRDPFRHPTQLVTGNKRSAPVLTFEGRKHALKELMVSGLTIDVSAGNSYDANTHSVLKGSSSSWPLISVGYITTDRLVIADNIFMNAAQGVASPRIRAMSNDAEVVVFNNIFINNIHTWVIEEGGYKNTVNRYIIAANSFILNWPYNLDPTTSNPGTIEIGDQYSASAIDIVGNLFAYNSGGAIHTQYNEDRTPPLTLTHNLFWGNGRLFGDIDHDDGVVVGKFAGAATYATLGVDDLEDDFDWRVEGNLSFDPGLVLTAAAEPATYPALSGVSDSNALLSLLTDTALTPADNTGATSSDSTSDSTNRESAVSALSHADNSNASNSYAPHFPFDRNKLPMPTTIAGVGAGSSLVVQY